MRSVENKGTKGLGAQVVRACLHVQNMNLEMKNEEAVSGNDAPGWTYLSNPFWVEFSCQPSI